MRAVRILATHCFDQKSMLHKGSDMVPTSKRLGNCDTSNNLADSEQKSTGSGDDVSEAASGQCNESDEDGQTDADRRRHSAHSPEQRRDVLERRVTGALLHQCHLVVICVEYWIITPANFLDMVFCQLLYLKFEKGIFQSSPGPGVLTLNLANRPLKSTIDSSIAHTMLLFLPYTRSFLKSYL